MTHPTIERHPGGEALSSTRKGANEIELTTKWNIGIEGRDFLELNADRVNLIADARGFEATGDFTGNRLWDGENFKALGDLVNRLYQESIELLPKYDFGAFEQEVLGSNSVPVQWVTFDPGGQWLTIDSSDDYWNDHVGQFVWVHTILGTYEKKEIIEYEAGTRTIWFDAPMGVAENGVTQEFYIEYQAPEGFFLINPPLSTYADGEYQLDPSNMLFTFDLLGRNWTMHKDAMSWWHKGKVIKIGGTREALIIERKYSGLGTIPGMPAVDPITPGVQSLSVWWRPMRRID